MKDLEEHWPLPAPGAHGWPWDRPHGTFPASMPNGKPWPRISVVTPSYNQGEYIEETIRSVLMQGYPNLQYIIMDGGSSDETVEVIRRYEKWIDHWVSEKDRGQTHAINKGFAMADGDIVAWINSDDYYLPGSLEQVALAHARNPGAILLGDVEEFSEAGELGVQRMHHVDAEHLRRPMDGSWMWHQPGTFVPGNVVQEAGPLDEALHYAFDKDWMFRMLALAPVEYLNKPLARFRIHEAAKTRADLDKAMREIFLVNSRHMIGVPRAEMNRLSDQYHMRLAGLHLCEHPGYEPFFDRLAALRELFKTPRGLCSSSGVRLLGRALLPRALWRTG